MSGLAAALAALLARLRPLAAARPGTMALEQVLALDPRRRLCLVRCGARRVVLLTGGAQDLLVGWLDDDAPEAG